VWAQDQEITWVVADLWVEVMYFEIRLAVPFFKSERTELTSPFVQFSEQNANCRGYTLVALGRTWKHAWTWLARRILSNAQQFSFRQLSRALSCQPRQNLQFLLGFRIRPCSLKVLSRLVLFPLSDEPVQGDSV